MTEQILSLLPKKGIKFRELDHTKELAVYTTYDGFHRYDWKPLRDYLKLEDWKLLFILDH